MTPQERDVISGIFDKLKSASNQPRDPEAEKLIAEKITAQPYAPYAMAQAVYVQEQALLNLQQQVETLQAQVGELQNQPQAPQGGFLSGIFGGKPQTSVPATGPGSGRPIGLPPGFAQGGTQPAPSLQAQPMQPQAPAGPWGGAQQRPGGGFLQTAMATAAGVAGGVVLGNVLMNAFGGDKAAAQTANKPDPAADTASISPPERPAEFAETQPSYQPASHEDAGGFDSGGDDGGGDWA